LTPDAAQYVRESIGQLEMSASQSVLTAMIFLVAGVAATTMLLRTRDLA